jgi:type IV pilus assembly protein PilA
MLFPRCLGFTLIEMMVILGIIAVLALMMLPAYTEKFTRDQIAEALPLADVAEGPLAAAWSLAQAFPADNQAAGLPPGDKIVNNFVRAVTVENGAIHITFGNRANAAIKDKILTVRPAVIEDAPVVPVTWVCGFAEQPDKMVIKGVNKTAIPAGLLPFKCRSNEKKTP